MARKSNYDKLPFVAVNAQQNACAVGWPGDRKSPSFCCHTETRRSLR